MKQDHEDGITPAIGHPLEGLTRGTTTHLGQELSAIRIQIAEVPLRGSQLAEKRQFGPLALDGARALARSTLPEPLEGRPAVRGLGLERVRDKAGGRSRSGAQIARNEAEVAKGTKLKREPQAVCCPPPDGDEVSVGTRQRGCSDQVIARDFLGKAGPPSQLSL